jgi:hypothetical protein
MKKPKATIIKLAVPVIRLKLIAIAPSPPPSELSLPSPFPEVPFPLVEPLFDPPLALADCWNAAKLLGPLSTALIEKTKEQIGQ